MAKKRKGMNRDLDGYCVILTGHIISMLTDVQDNRTNTE